MSLPIILCVDDEKMILDNLREQIERWSNDQFIVEIAQSAEEGLQVLGDLIADGEEVSIVVSDQKMEGMQGDEFLRCVRDKIPTARLILLTGGDNPMEKEHLAMEAAGLKGHTLFHFLAKPWSEAELFAMLDECVNLRTGTATA
ncbi:MAG: response regulator [Bacteroidia bacterium]|nr:response regulator [Bacteroidia bacterium]